jgi:hypothetical protein
MERSLEKSFSRGYYISVESSFVAPGWRPVAEKREGVVFAGRALAV